MSGVSVNGKVITVTGNNVTLNGYDFSQNGGYCVNIAAGVTGTVIENCNFVVDANGDVPINASSASCGNLTVNYCTLNGGPTSNGNGNCWALINYDGTGTLQCTYNYFENSPEDDIDMGGTVTPIIEYNLFVNSGTSSGSHPDSIQFVGDTVKNLVMSYNTVYQPNPSGMEGIQVCAQLNGSTITNSTVSNNTIVAKGPSPTLQMSCAIAIQQGSGCTINGCNVTGNYIDPTGMYYPFYTPQGSNLTYTNNVDMVTGTVLPNPQLPDEYGW